MKKERIIEKVYSFYIENDDLIYCDFNKNLFNNNNVFLDKNVDSYCYAFFLGNIIYVKNENTFINDKIINEKTFVKDTTVLQNHTIILSGEFELSYPDYSNNYYLYNIDSNKSNFITKYHNLIYITQQNVFVYLTEKKLIVLNLMI
jgi:hypothetical protein